jgi:hypothetical protein
MPMRLPGSRRRSRSPASSSDPRRPRSGAFLRALALLALGWPRPGAAQAAAAEEPRNWFDDPFLQVSAAVPECPPPAGPFITEAERRIQSHHRAERGTTCWLAGRCDRPNFYAYDADIGRALEAAWRRAPAVADSTLWITVQGRTVFIEGCVRDPAAASTLEAYARAIPEVQQAIAIVYAGPPARAPYRLRAPPAN